MNQARILDTLNSYPVFGRDDVWVVMNKGDGRYSVNTAYAFLQRMLKEGLIHRVGRNKYTVSAGNVSAYEHSYSELAQKVAKAVIRNYPELDFTIFEMVQLNRFVNHQIAHNVVFLSVESDLGDYVFDLMKQKFPGHVLNNPSVQLYDQYWTDDLIIINRLLTEAPMGAEVKWHTCIEKMLVDLFAEPLYQEIIHKGEYPAIYKESFSRYTVDESRMFRYARRRNAQEKIKAFISEKTNISLRTVG